MKQIKSIVAAIALASTTIGGTQASEVDLGFGDDSIKLSFLRSGAFSDRTQLNASYYHHKDDGDMFDIDVLVGDATAKTNLLIGGKAFYTKNDNYSGSGVALGFTGQYALPNKFALKGKAFYAPNMLSFSDVDDYHELEARVAYHLIPEAELALGYRHAGFGVENGPSVKIQEQVFIGLTMHF